MGVVGVSGKRPRISVRVDETTKEQIEQDHLNTSSLVRELLKNYVRVGDTVEVSLRRRLKDKEAELENKRLEKTQLENEIDRLEREVDELQEKIKQRQESTPEEVIEFVEKVKADSFPREQLDTENPAIQTWANKAGLPPDRFVSEVDSRL